MTYKYVYEPRAMLEYLEALTWYAERSVQAAENFEKAITTKLADICKHPTRFRNAKKYFREALLKTYPFVIVFVFEEEAGIVVITSIFHQSRHPKNKFK